MTSNIGRGRFRERPARTVELNPTRRQVEWLKFLNLHGCLPSSYLHELTRDTAKSERATQHQLRRLWLGGYIYRPKQQRATDNANYHEYVYDLTDKGISYLKLHGLYVDAYRPRSFSSSDKWPHNFMISCITATMHIMCLRCGYEYVPPHVFAGQKLKIENVPFLYDGRRRKKHLTPDSVFAIGYPDGHIAYALEADRNTEPNDAADWKRKSAKSSVLQYQSVIGNKLYQKTYGRQTPMMLIYVTVSATHANNILQVISDNLGPCHYIAVGVATDFEPPFWRPPRPLTHLFERSLGRAAKSSWVVKRV
ncbi:replication-relaxation family protein [Hoeflea poritis]|uniref:Replication-relaxation family protein n=1 Tax=Hoeflea poritis TaxID=2993659 RepID=A0ABT4VNX6_9HYPH|nr:replication-relaxation family protein [Hoeflea poritis]MDA4846415.1 replication-relaxation family protein [Hoeflea poritis]